MLTSKKLDRCISYPWRHAGGERRGKNAKLYYSRTLIQIQDLFKDESWKSHDSADMNITDVNSKLAQALRRKWRSFEEIFLFIWLNLQAEC